MLIYIPDVLGSNWRSPLDKEYDRLVDLAAMAMIGPANKPELSKHSCAYAQKATARRRAAIEPVIGHLKAEHRMGRNYLAHHAGDAVNAVLAAAVITSISRSNGWSSCCLDSSRLKKQRPPFNGSENRKLHGRLFTTHHALRARIHLQSRRCKTPFSISCGFVSDDFARQPTKPSGRTITAPIDVIP